MTAVTHEQITALRAAATAARDSEGEPGRLAAIWKFRQAATPAAVLSLLDALSGEAGSAGERQASVESMSEQIAAAIGRLDAELMEDDDSQHARDLRLILDTYEGAR